MLNRKNNSSVQRSENNKEIRRKAKVIFYSIMENDVHGNLVSILVLCQNVCWHRFSIFSNGFFLFGGAGPGRLNFQGAFTKGHTRTKCYLSKFVVEANSVEFLCSALGDSLG